MEKNLFERFFSIIVIYIAIYIVFLKNYIIISYIDIIFLLYKLIN